MDAIQFFDFWNDVTGLTCFNLILIFPLIFNLWVIPKIEKRLGVKLVFVNKIFEYIRGFRWMCRYTDIMLSIIIYSVFKRKNKLKNGHVFALEKVNYDFRKAGKLEIIMSILACVNALLLAISVVIFYIYRNLGLITVHYESNFVWLFKVILKQF